MFTGIIEHTPMVHAVSGSGLVIYSPDLSSQVKIGDSVAINGCCLTVHKFEEGRLYFDVSHETFAVTTLSSFKVNDFVNAELALKVGDRFGGHVVSGHVDGKGVIKQIEKKGDFWDVTLALPLSCHKLVVPKGSIAVDGISLTINRVDPVSSSSECVHIGLTLIPETMKKTCFASAVENQEVNIEYDMMVKNLVHVLNHYSSLLKTAEF